MAFSMESSSLNFVGTDTATYTFSQSYPYPPIVTATADSSINVNIFVESVSSTQAVIRSSAKGVFTVYVHVMGYPNT